MMLQNKLDRAMKWLNQKNKKQEENIDEFDLENYDPKAEWLKEQEENPDLEKNDWLALFLAAAIVFLPIFAVLIFILYVTF